MILSLSLSLDTHTHPHTHTHTHIPRCWWWNRCHCCTWEGWHGPRSKRGRAQIHKGQLYHVRWIFDHRIPEWVIASFSALLPAFWATAGSVSTFGSTEVASFPYGKRRGETISSLHLYPGNKAAIGGIHVK